MTKTQQPFSKLNFWLIGGCCLLIVIGFLLMLGSGSSVEEGFNPDIFSTRRIVVGPLLTFLGFLLLAFAILVDDEKLKTWRQGRKERREKKAVALKEETAVNQKTEENGMA